MTMIVNNQPPENTGNNGMGFVLGIVVLIIVVVLVIYYGIPYLRGIGGGYQVNVPSNINVNVHTNQK